MEKTVLLFFQVVHFHNSVQFGVAEQFLIFGTSDLLIALPSFPEW
jgi:hypothetical protein